MRNSKALFQHTGNKVTAELTAYQVPFVAVDPVAYTPDLSDATFRDFVVANKVSRISPFVWVGRGFVINNLLEPRIAPQFVIDWAVFTGMRYYDNHYDVDAVHKAMVGRLSAGEPITLVPATAAALRPNAPDMMQLELTSVERRILKLCLAWVRRTRKPMFVCVGLIEGKRRYPRWYPSIAVYFASHRFVLPGH